jgi:hypothetical protein
MIMMAVSSIHVVVRAMDDLTILMFRNTWALQVVPFKHFGFVESCPAHDACKGVEAFYEVDAERGFIITSVRACPRCNPVAPRACAPLRVKLNPNPMRAGLHHHRHAGHSVQRD